MRIFWILFLFFRIYLIARDPWRWRGAMRTHGGATQAHVDAYVVPTWREQWYRTVGIKSCNWTVGIKSRDWIAEITRNGIHVMGHDPTNSRDPTVEITWSGIRIMGHYPTDFTRFDGWNHTEWNPCRGPRSTDFAQTSL